MRKTLLPHAYKRVCQSVLLWCKQTLGRFIFFC